MSTRSFVWVSPLLCAALFRRVQRGAHRRSVRHPAVVSVRRAAAPQPSRFYQQHKLLSDVAGAADKVDPNLVNACGIVSGPTTPWWISDNGPIKRRSTLYSVRYRDRPQCSWFRRSWRAERADRHGVPTVGTSLCRGPTVARHERGRRFIFSMRDMHTSSGFFGGGPRDRGR